MHVLQNFVPSRALCEKFRDEYNGPRTWRWYRALCGASILETGATELLSSILEDALLGAFSRIHEQKLTRELCDLILSDPVSSVAYTYILELVKADTAIESLSVTSLMAKRELLLREAIVERLPRVRPEKEEEIARELINELHTRLYTQNSVLWIDNSLVSATREFWILMEPTGQKA